MALNNLDWTIIAGYLAGMIGLSVLLARGQRSSRDYYLGGNKTGALPIALSTMATQCSTNSLLGAPAFVAFAAGGGLVWLQYELAVPLAMIGLMVLLYPVFRSLNLISLYAYLEKRYGVGTRTGISVLFQFLRVFSTGVTVYGISLVIVTATAIPFWAAVLALGVVTVVYDIIGGMKAVIWSDVIQLVVLLGAILSALWIAVDQVGGVGETWGAFAGERKVAIDLRGHGLGDGKTFAFWPMLFGGLFLYLSYYGCDQTQAQRMLATRHLEDTQKALFWGGLLRFPLVLVYCLLGVAIGAYASVNPGFLNELFTQGGSGEPDYNLAVPAFVINHFPHGMIGLVMVGLFAAAMSSLDSTINSLSAVTMQDIIERFSCKPLSERQQLVCSKLLTLFWGVVCLVFAFYVGDISDTVIESVNKIGSLINGPLLAIFLLGILSRRINGTGINIGLVCGFAGNLLLWRFAPDVSWLWWNVAGFLVTAAIAFPVSLATAPPGMKSLSRTTLEGKELEFLASKRRNWLRYSAILLSYFAVILVILLIV